MISNKEDFKTLKIWFFELENFAQKLEHFLSRNRPFKDSFLSLNWRWNTTDANESFLAIFGSFWFKFWFGKRNKPVSIDTIEIVHQIHMILLKIMDNRIQTCDITYIIWIYLYLRLRIFFRTRISQIWGQMLLTLPFSVFYRHFIFFNWKTRQMNSIVKGRTLTRALLTPKSIPTRFGKSFKNWIPFKSIPMPLPNWTIQKYWK